LAQNNLAAAEPSAHEQIWGAGLAS